MAGFMLGVVVRMRPGLGGTRCPCNWVGLGAITRCDMSMWGRVVLVADRMTL